MPKFKNDAQKIEFLNKTYKYSGNTVEYAGDLYSPRTLNYCLMDNLEFRVEKETAFICAGGFK